jgi:hypothetical protein
VRIRNPVHKVSKEHDRDTETDPFTPLPALSDTPIKYDRRPLAQPCELLPSPQLLHSQIHPYAALTGYRQGRDLLPRIEKMMD